MEQFRQFYDNISILIICTLYLWLLQSKLEKRNGDNP